MADATYQGVIYKAQGGIEMVFPSGTTLTIDAGATFASAGTQTFDDIIGGDASLDINGQLPASVTSAGGTVVLTGAIGGATSGAGGAISVIGGAGTAAQAGVGGAVILTSGAPAAGTTGTASASGAITVTAAAGGACSTGTGGAGGTIAVAGGTGGAASGDGTGGAGSPVTITGGTGGAADANSASEIGGAGGDVTLTAGVGGSADSKTGGAGGSVILAASAAGETTELDGQIYIRPVDGAPLMTKRAAPEADDTTDTNASEAEILAGMFVKSPTSAQNWQLPTGAEISAAIGANLAVGDSFDFTLINTGTASDIVTLTTDTGLTLIGYMGVHPAADGATLGVSCGTFRFRNTGSNAWSVYRVG